MKRILPLFLSCCAPLVTAQTLAVKPGAWEMTNKSTAFPRPMVEKECVTKADLEQLTNGPDKDEDQQCKLVKPPTVSGNKWTADRKCPDGRTVHAEFVAESPEKVTGTMASTAPNGGPVFRIDVTGKWLGSSCAGIK